MKEVAKIIIHDDDRVLLQLRDNNPNIAFPLHWNLIGGIIEVSELPQETITRELKEELGIELDKIELFAIENYKDTIQHIFSAKAKINPEKIHLKEGLAIRWFKLSELSSLKIGFNYYEILMKFKGS